MTALLVVLGAAVGAPLRYLVDRFIQGHHTSVFPWGTLAVNVIGSALLGLLAGLPAPDTILALAGTGLCGALTTYSTFGYETLRLARDGARLHAAANVAGNITVGLAAAYGSFALARAVTG